jgi:ABC-type bacteriocin/lantibiotic exporter with double-glycine peptidase domain
MKIRIPIVSTIIFYFRVFWDISGLMFPLLIGLSLVSGFLEGFSLALCIPLLGQTELSLVEDNKVTEILNSIYSLLGISVTLTNTLLLIGFTLSGAIVARTCQNILRIYVVATVSRRWKLNILKHIGNVDYQHFINLSTGFLNNLIVTESDRAIGAFQAYCMVIGKIISIIIYILFTFFLSWQLTLVGISIGLFFMFSSKSIFWMTKKYSRMTSSENSKLQEYMIQTIQSYKYLKVTNSFRFLFEKIVQTINKLLRYELTIHSIKMSLKGGLDLYVIWMVIGMIFFQVSYLGKSLGSVLVLALFLQRTSNEINAFQITWHGFCGIIGGVEIVSSACKKLEKNKENSGSQEISTFKKEIQLNSLSFSYGNHDVLKNINISISRNSSIAIVGQSGAGKSTLVDIFTGVLKPSRGTIKIDGVDYSQINYTSLRKLIGYVPQEILLFNESILNNVSLWTCQPEDIDCKNRVIDAIKRANGEQFVTETVEQYNTQIGDRGTKVSGGQRQRLAIARELFRNPEIIIFDEATSALDSKSELFIQQSVDDLRNKKTIILIAHRLSTIKNCDYIYVLAKGKIVEKGTYQELYDSRLSLFRNMCDMQTLG